MALIQIQEIPDSTNPNGTNGADSIPAEVRATLSFDHGPQYPITLHNPFSEEDEHLLEWYFEEHLEHPYKDKVKALNAGKSIATYGESLFKQIFADPKAFSRYDQCLQAGLNTCQIEIVGSPVFHRWHWEALKDPDLPRPLSLQATIVRKKLQPSSIEASVQPSPTINMLIVIARPNGPRDVGYRTISRPLVESLRQSAVPVQIDILRPGTYKALSQHLRETTDRHGVGYYHVIHFDVHGALLSYAQFEHVQRGEVSPQPTPYAYQHPYGRETIQPYQGYKAFISLEDEHANKADLVEAQALVTLLTEHHIPIAILNACQAGKETGTSESSLGSRLMQAGVQLVLAMGYSVTVSAARLLMSTLYRKLFDQHDLSTAISQARQELYNNKERRAYSNYTIDLEDWLLPIVYQNQPPRLTTRAFTPQEEERYYERRDSYKPTQPGFGFVGRDLDILQIEKRLLTKRNLVLIRGMGGAGKTTLLQHLGEWWQKTGFIEHVFYFGYDQQAWNVQQLITSIAQQLYTPVEYLRDFQPLSLKAQQAKLCARLRAERHLLILDNLESITGTALAIQHTLPVQEQQALRRFLIDLVGGRTLVLLGSRGTESWLAKETFSDNIHDLGGLDPEAASQLTDLILEKYNLTKYRTDNDLQHLIKLLDGFPLALEVVLANLKRQTPTEVLTALQSGSVTLNVGDTQARTENILRCIDYSHSNLSPDAQSLLVCLAPFTSVIRTDTLSRYTEQLKNQPTLVALPFERWQEVLQEAQNWGLLSIDANFPVYLHIQPTLPYFLRSRLNTSEQAEVRRAVETAFREYYDEYGSALYALLDSKEPQERQIGQVLTSLEYENLMTALNLALEAQVSILNFHRTLSNYLDTTQEQQRGLELSQAVLKCLERYPAERLATQLGPELVGVVDRIASRQLELKRYEEAKVSYEKALALWLDNKSLDTDALHKGKASIYHQLGMVAEKQRKWQDAEQSYQQALQIYNGYQDRDGQVRTYVQLGVVAMEQRKWKEAEENYQQALQIRGEYQDRHGQAGVYHGLGRVAQDQRNWEEAELYYQQALDIYREYNDLHEQARIYHQLGMVARLQRKLKEAELYYQQALQIFIEYQDRHGQAGSYQSLGVMAREGKQWEEARGYFLQALEIFIIYKDGYHSAMALGNLALLWQASGDTTLPAAIAPILNATAEEVEAALRKMLEGDGEGEAE